MNLSEAYHRILAIRGQGSKITMEDWETPLSLVGFVNQMRLEIHPEHLPALVYFEEGDGAFRFMSYDRNIIEPEAELEERWSETDDATISEDGLLGYFCEGCEIWISSLGM